MKKSLVARNLSGSLQLWQLIPRALLYPGMVQVQTRNHVLTLRADRMSDVFRFFVAALCHSLFWRVAIECEDCVLTTKENPHGSF